MKRLLPIILLAGIVLLTAGCAMLEVASSAGAAIGQATGAITPGQAESIKKTGKAVSKTLEDITPEQEYYIGRAVAATILKTYKPFDKAEANQYLNLLGQSLSAASDKPETFKGYHFLVMDTDEINAFAAPSGFILVSRGLIRCCKTESALAAVLAHEVGHVQKAHGLQAIKKGRVNSALTTIAVEAGKNLAGDQLAEITTAFEGSITDITGTLVNSGYARKLEVEADKIAIEILNRVGYDPRGLQAMLGEMKTRMQGAEHKGFASTHPTPDQRLQEIASLLPTGPAGNEPKPRQERFQKFLGGI